MLNLERKMTSLWSKCYTFPQSVLSWEVCDHNASSNKDFSSRTRFCGCCTYGHCAETRTSSTPTLPGGYWTFPHQALSKFSEKDRIWELPVPLFEQCRFWICTSLLHDDLRGKEARLVPFQKNRLWGVPLLRQIPSWTGRVWHICLTLCCVAVAL